MTTDTQLIPADSRLRTLRWRRFLVAFLLSLGVLVALAAAAAFAYSSMHQGKILPGVAIAGVDVAGLTPAQAQDRLEASLPDVSSGAMLVHVGSVERRVAYTDIGRHYELEASIEQAMSVGRGGNPLDQLAQQVRTMLGGVSITPTISYDAQILSQRVADAVAEAEVTPVNASISFKNGAYVVSPATGGQSVDGAEALRQAIAALNTDSTADTTVEVAAVDVSAEITTPDAEAAVERARAVTDQPLAIDLGSRTEMIDALTLRGWVRLEETAPGSWDLMVAREPIDQLVAVYRSETDQPAVEATFGFQDNHAVALPGQVGYSLDAAAGADAIYAALTARGDGNAVNNVSIPVITTTPTLTTEQAQALADQVKLLGEWTTHYIPSSHNGHGQNIRRPADLIDGTVIQPGEMFDFVGVAGPITKGNGYTDGAAIIHGKTKGEGVLGGGLCSASTTIFNAALRAGFEMHARRNHAYYIDRYPVGLDATIWISGSRVQTMSFTNDSGYPILIRGINRRRTVKFQIFGIDDGRKVTLSKPEVTNQRKAHTYYQFTDALGPREQKRTEYAADGFNSVVVRTVKDASGILIHEDTFRSNYLKVDGIIQVGRATGDPKAGTRILVSDGLPPVSTPKPPPDPTPKPTKAPTPSPDPTPTPEYVDRRDLTTTARPLSTAGRDGR